MYSKKPLLPDQIYHVYNRGINRESIFKEERNYDHFLRLYVEYAHPCVTTYAYCLLPNHFHFLIRTHGAPQISDFSEKSDISPNLDPNEQFRRLFLAYAKAINHAYGRTGALFQHRFGRILVDNDRYLTHLVRYIHHNPQHHGLVADYRTWRYSSFGAYRGQHPTRVACREVFDWFGSQDGFLAGHDEPGSVPGLDSVLGDCD